jgi:small subunit ribosomal protein S6
MHKYELVIVFKPTLEEEGLKDEFDKVQDIITRFEGVIDKVDDWGKRRLAYEIDKLNEGYYRFVTFTSSPSAPAEIESRLRIRENVIRFLIVRKEE